MVNYNPSESEEKVLSVEEVTVVTAVFDHFKGYEEACVPLGSDTKTFYWHANRIKNTGNGHGTVFCEVAELDELNNVIEVICRADTEVDASECALFWADSPGSCELAPYVCTAYTQRVATRSQGKYYFGMKTWGEDETEPLYTDINPDKVKTWSVTVKKITCDEPTEHFASGCELLLHYDENNDGIIDEDELTKVREDNIAGLLNDCELASIRMCHSATSINDLCPGCYVEPAHDTALTIDVVDELGNPITTAFVGDTICISGQLSDIVTGELLTGAAIKLYRNDVDTGLTDTTNESGVYSIPYTVVSGDVPTVRFKTAFGGT